MAKRKAPVAPKKAKRVAPIRGRIQNMGGNLIDPPDNCPFSRRFPDGAVWTDLGCCQQCCKEHCDLFRWFCDATPRMRVRRLRRKGIYYPWDG